MRTCFYIATLFSLCVASHALAQDKPSILMSPLSTPAAPAAAAPEVKPAVPETKPAAKPNMPMGDAASVPEATPAPSTAIMPVLPAAPQPSEAVAGIGVAPKLVREGVFEAAACTPTGGASFNECLCRASINKAELVGASPSVTSAVNKILAQVPEQLGNESCQGTKAASAPEINMNSSAASYEVPYHSPQILTVLVTYSTYGAGSAHPLSGTEGYTFNLTKGELVNPLERLNGVQMGKLNQFILAELNKKYGDQLFDEVKTREDPFIVETTCDSCTVYYTKEGWNIRFQLYAIAPYAAGEPTITIPADILPSPEKS